MRSVIEYASPVYQNALPGYLLDELQRRATRIISPHVPNRAWNMHTNAQNVEWNTRSKISCYYTWLLHSKNCPSRRRFVRRFSLLDIPSKSSRRSITEAKRKDNEKSLKTYVAFSLKTRSFYFCACPSKNVEKRFECLWHQITILWLGSKFNLVNFWTWFSHTWI